MRNVRAASARCRDAEMLRNRQEEYSREIAKVSRETFNEKYFENVNAVNSNVYVRCHNLYGGCNNRRLSKPFYQEDNSLPKIY